MATKFYFDSLTAPNLAPPAPGAEWEHFNLSVARRMNTTKQASPMTTFDCFAYDGADHLVDQDALVVQLVSLPINAAAISNSIPNNRIKSQVRCSELNNPCNQVMALKLYLIDSKGVFKADLLAITRGATEFATSLANRLFNVVMTAGPVTCADGDRIVLELGSGGTPSSGVGTNGHNVRMSIGDDSASDLPEDDSTTAADNPWVQFGTTTFSFLPELAPPPLMHRPHRFFNRRF